MLTELRRSIQFKIPITEYTSSNLKVTELHGCENFKSRFSKEDSGEKALLIQKNLCINLNHNDYLSQDPLIK